MRRKQRGRENIQKRQNIKGVVWRLLLAGLFLYLAGTFLQVWQARQADEAAPADAIVVLGAAQWNGRPSPVLRARLDHAIALYHAGYAPRLITTGGHGPDPRFTEAGVGADYAVAHGVPREAILMEEVGISTWTSMQEVQHLAAAHGLQRLIVVSDPFHIARIKEMAARLGLVALGSPTRTSPISRNPRVELGYLIGEVKSLTVLRLGLQR